MSGIPKERKPKSLPKDPAAAEALRAYAQSSEYSPILTQLDLRGADLSECDLVEAWLTESNLEAVAFRGADLHRAHLDGVQANGADFRSAWLRRADFSDAVAIAANFDEADLGSAEFFGVNAQRASMRGASLNDTGLSDSDLRGADLTNAKFGRTRMLRVTMDEETVLAGVSGTVFGPMVIVNAGERTEIDGLDLEHWFSNREARVEVLKSNL